MNELHSRTEALQCLALVVKEAVEVSNNRSNDDSSSKLKKKNLLKKKFRTFRPGAKQEEEPEETLDASKGLDKCIKFYQTLVGNSNENMLKEQIGPLCKMLNINLDDGWKYLAGENLFYSEKHNCQVINLASFVIGLPKLYNYVSKINDIQQSTIISTEDDLITSPTSKRMNIENDKALTEISEFLGSTVATEIINNIPLNNSNLTDLMTQLLKKMQASIDKNRSMFKNIEDTIKRRNEEHEMELKRVFLENEQYLQKEKTKLTEENFERMNEVEEKYKNIVCEKNDKINEVTEQFEKQQSELKLANDSLNELNINNVQLTVELENIRSKYSYELNENTMLNEQLANCRKEIETLNNQIELVKNDVMDNCSSKISSLENGMEELLHMNESLRRKLSCINPSNKYKQESNPSSPDNKSRRIFFDSKTSDEPETLDNYLDNGSKSTDDAESNTNFQLDCIEMVDKHQQDVEMIESNIESKILNSENSLYLKMVPELLEEPGSIIDETPMIPDITYDIILIGDSAVGKTSFIRRICTNKFVETTMPTTGIDFMYLVKQTTFDNKNINVQLQFWDTAGQERFNCLTRTFFRKADFVFIMFDYARVKSVDNIIHWTSEAQLNTMKGCMFKVIGNKYDLYANENNDIPHKDMVEKIGHIMKQLQLEYSSVSAKTGNNVSELIDETIQILLKNKYSKPKNESSIINKGMEANTNLTTQQKSGCC